MTTSLAYKYDAFISYSHKDEKWVRETLLTILEKNGLKVIIDYRDFEPGAPSITEMERAVNESWKTILVLTPNYINSAWSEFESIMIATLDPAGRQRRILPILLQHCNIPLRINYLTYLDLSDLKIAKSQWDKLMTAFDNKGLGIPSSAKKLTPLKEVSTMSRISSDTHKEFRKVLMDSDELSTQARLRALFADPRLSSFKSSIPEASSVAERADLLIDFLVSRKLRSGESLVVVFLDVLRTKVDPDDARVVAIEEISGLMRIPTDNIPSVDSRIGMDDILSSQSENLDRYKKITQIYRQNLLLIEEQMAAFIDPRNIAPDLKIARIEIIKKIQEFEGEISFQNSLLSIAGPKIIPEEITNKDLINRLDRLENAINIQYHNLKLGLASIYRLSCKSRELGIYGVGRK